MKKITINKAIAVAALAGAACLPAAQAGVIQLGFILDESGSIGEANYTIIKNGLASAISTLIPLGGAYEVSVVSFSNSATILVNHMLITDAASRTAAANLVSGDTFSAGSTAMDAAFNSMSSVLQASTATIDFTYVNFATDGVPNDQTSATTARNNLIANAGVDNLSIEAIGGGVNATYLQNSICYPSPCDTTSPYSFPGNGFYIAVADAQGYADAIGNKIRVVTGQPLPEPGSLALAGLALLGLVRLRRKHDA